MDTQLRATFGQHSDRGIKPINQDYCDARIPDVALLDIKGIAIAMADGISTSDHSHIASQNAVNGFLEDYYCTSEAWSVEGSAKRVISALNSALYSQTMSGPSRFNKDQGFVCTLSAVVVRNRFAHLFHVGDTRIYRLNDLGLEKLTNDHRVWQEEKSYLSRALGFEESCEIDHRVVPIKPGDTFIITTDGVHEFTDVSVMCDAISAHSDDLTQASKVIVEQALVNGSDDNLSIQILRIDKLPELALNKVRRQIEQLPFPPALRERKVFDGYTIIRELHANSRSHVYLAYAHQENKNVVLKAPSVDLGDNQDYLEHFLMEEWVARRMNHVNVLKTDLPERPRNYIYTVFEFIDGQSLAQWARDHPKPDIETVRNIVEQVAKGLHAFHRKTMLHQDLRPENVMIDKMGTIKLIDFGSVSVGGVSSTKNTCSSACLPGTALYCAPEYFLGEAGTVQSDLFSLGVLTYFLLSGTYPYGTDVAMAKTKLAQRNLSYRSILKDDREIPAWVDDALRKATHPSPGNRYEEVFELLADLRRPSQAFLNKSKPPLAERHPVGLWQTISLVLGLLVLYLLYVINNSGG